MVPYGQPDRRFLNSVVCSSSSPRGIVLIAGRRAVMSLSTDKRGGTGRLVSPSSGRIRPLDP